MHIFIDANIFLGFYSLSPGELEELRKLGALIDGGDLTLWLPEHAADEFWRNRPKVLDDAVKALRESRLKVVFPEIGRGLEEQAALEAAVRAAQKAHSALLTAVEEVIDSEQLDADKVISDLFRRARNIPTAHLMQRARDRRDLRKQPGKGEGLGDALNWEALLESVPGGEDMHIVTADGDFRSPLGASKIHEALYVEWGSTKRSTVRLYRDLGAFSKKHFPDLQLATDVPKLKAIRALASSGSFADTHAIVARLAEFSLFSPVHARLLIRAAVDNSQVRWIATDDDVSALLRRVIDAHLGILDANDVAILEREMHPPAPAINLGSDDDDDLPF